MRSRFVEGFLHEIEAISSSTEAGEGAKEVLEKVAKRKKDRLSARSLAAIGFGLGAAPGLGKHLKWYLPARKKWAGEMAPKGLVGTSSSAISKAWTALKKPKLFNPFILYRTLMGGVLGGAAGAAIGKFRKRKRK